MIATQTSKSLQWHHAGAKSAKSPEGGLSACSMLERAVGPPKPLPGAELPRLQGFELGYANRYVISLVIFAGG